MRLVHYNLGGLPRGRPKVLHPRRMLPLSSRSGSISIVRMTMLRTDLVFVSPVCSVGVVWNSLWALEFVKARW